MTGSEAEARLQEIEAAFIEMLEGRTNDDYGDYADDIAWLLDYIAARKGEIDSNEVKTPDAR